jgi:hypothetical protein
MLFARIKNKISVILLRTVSRSLIVCPAHQRLQNPNRTPNTKYQVRIQKERANEELAGCLLKSGRALCSKRQLKRIGDSAFAE